MPRTAPRGGPQTRARIAEAANGLFVERGFDAVTVADVARAAGVSSVTVFNHFPTKEDLFLDRADEAVEVLRSAVRDRAPGTDAVTALEQLAFELFEEREPFSGVDPRSTPFFRTIAGSPSLVTRARTLEAELQRSLTEQLAGDPSFTGDAALLAAFFISGYATVMVGTARRLLGGEAPESLLDDHGARLSRLFSAIRGAFPA
jgi:AcrR family transcriptional regulator